MPSRRAMPHPPHPGPAGAPAQVHVLDRRGARAIDAAAAERYAMPTLLLMENAARAVAEVALDMLGDDQDTGVLVVCGPGNNGGDGFAAARHLHNSGARVAIVLACPPARLTGDAATNFAIVSRMGLPIIAPEAAEREPDVAAAVNQLGGLGIIVDALLGTGLERPVSGPLAGLVRWMNERHAAGVRVLAVDLPSGLDCDTGRPLGVAVIAEVTVTFAGLKRGFLELVAQEYIGEVVVADIGVPRELVAEFGRPVTLDGHADSGEDLGPTEDASPKPGDSAS